LRPAISQKTLKSTGLQFPNSSEIVRIDVLAESDAHPAPGSRLRASYFRVRLSSENAF
jgi:hypothetical protein